MEMVLLVVLSLATYRINRLIIRDTIFDRPRAALINWLLPRRLGGWAVDLITCPFCIGIWVSGACTIAATSAISVPIPVLFWMASAAGSMIVWSIIEDD